MVIAGIFISVALLLVSILYIPVKLSLQSALDELNWTELLLKTMTADYWAASDFTPVAIAVLLRRGVQSGITQFRFVCGTSAQLAQSCIRQNELLLGHLRILCGSKWWVQWVKPRRVEQLQQSSTGTPSKRPCQKLLFRPKRVGEQEVCALCGLRRDGCQPYAFEEIIFLS